MELPRCRRAVKQCMTYQFDVAPCSGAVAPALPSTGKRLRIGLVAVRSANASQSWKGVFRALAQALEDAGADVIRIEIEDGTVGTMLRLKEYFVRRLIGRRYQRHREPLVLAAYGRAMDRALAEHGVDLAISLKAMPMSASQTSIPLILYNDSPFSGLLDFYPEFTGMSAGHVADGHAMEQQTAEKAAWSIYTSTWAADLAVRDYGVDPNRVSVVPIGANLNREPSRSEVEHYLDARAQSPQRRFLWLGVDWLRKRGALAVAIIEELRRRGYPVHLTVAGCGQNESVPASPDVTYIPFLDAAGIGRQLETTEFLLFPTLADCTPLVYSEANAFGVPVLSTDVGGIGTSVTDGRNGLLFDVHAPVSEWADRIAAYLDGQEDYRRLALSSFDEYTTRLNWKVTARRIYEIARAL